MLSMVKFMGESWEGEAMLVLPLRGVYALGLLCLGCARWRGMLHKAPPCNPRSSLPHLAARTLRTQDLSEPLLAPNSSVARHGEKF